MLIILLANEQGEIKIYTRLTTLYFKMGNSFSLFWDFFVHSLKVLNFEIQIHQGLNYFEITLNSRLVRLSKNNWGNVMQTVTNDL